MRHAVLTPFFGRLRDRFCEYHEPLPTVEKIRRAAAIAGVEGVELIYPDECRQASDVIGALREGNLAVAAVNVNLKGEAGFQHGALCSPDAPVRARALELLRGAKVLAAGLGCARVTLAPLADGYDYPLQTDYRTAWRRMVETLAEAAEWMPEIALHIEHKPAEPRTRGLVDTAAKAVRLCRDIGAPNAGARRSSMQALDLHECRAAWPAPDLAPGEAPPFLPGVAHSHGSRARALPSQPTREARSRDNRSSDEPAIHAMS